MRYSTNNHVCVLILCETAGVLSPPLSYDFLASMGAAKGKYSFTKTVFMGILAGVYIGFGALLAMSVCGNIPGEQSRPA